MSISKAELNTGLFDLAKRYAVMAQVELGAQLISIALYGSVARGQAGPGSDIDLFVVLQNAPSGMLTRRRLLDPIRESLTSELETLWRQGIYTDFIEVIRTQAEAKKFHSLYLDMSQEAIIFFDRDKFLESLLSAVKEQLDRGGAKRKLMERFRYWDLARLSIPDEVIEP